MSAPSIKRRRLELGEAIHSLRKAWQADCNLEEVEALVSGPSLTDQAVEVEMLSVLDWLWDFEDDCFLFNCFKVLAHRAKVPALKILCGDELDPGCDLRIPLIQWCLEEELLEIAHFKNGCPTSAFDIAEAYLQRGLDFGLPWSLEWLPELKERLQVISVLEGGFETHGNTLLHYVARYGIQIVAEDFAQVVEILLNE